jgi:hypothetical protein
MERIFKPIVHEIIIIFYIEHAIMNVRSHNQEYCNVQEDSDASG